MIECARVTSYSGAADLASRVITSIFRRYCRTAATFGFLSGLRRFGKSSAGVFPKEFLMLVEGLMGQMPSIIQC